MKQPTKLTKETSILLILVGITLAFFYAYVPQYFVPIALLVVTWPIVYYAGRLHERDLYEAYLALLDEEQVTEPITQVQRQPTIPKNGRPTAVPASTRRPFPKRKPRPQSRPIETGIQG